MHRPSRAALALALAFLPACSSSSDAGTPTRIEPRDGSGGGGGAPAGPLDRVPLENTLTGRGLSAPVELVRDELGVPHIYAETVADAAYAQGYITAHDRFVQMDFFRRNASGTLSELLGASALPSDIEPRLHHLRANAEAAWATLQASSEPLDREAVAALKAYAAGVNQWIDELKAGEHALPSTLVALNYRPEFVSAWSEVDSLAVGELQSFALSFDVDFDLLRTTAVEREKAVFAGASDPAYAKREGFVADVSDLRPIVPVFTVDGWGEFDGAARSPALVQPPLRAPEPDLELARLAARARSSRGGLPAFGPAERGSNNWVVSGAVSRSGHPMVANDTHLSLTNPSLFYMLHLSAGDFDVMGVQFPGVPLVTVGFNRRIAWGVTVSQLDVSDVYDEAVAPCAGGAGQCVSFRNGQVPLVPREETFRISFGGDVSKAEAVTLTFYDVPHHGPILPRVKAGNTLEPLGARELSVRYTGHEPYPIFRAILAVDRARSVDEARRAIEAHFAYGRQNWVLADVEGNIGWTQATRLPKRPAGIKPWLVLPGDGTAEWGNGDDKWDADDYVDPTKMPRAFDPAKGYLVTANADPIGVTADNDPANDASGDLPNYIGADYDPGARVGRITDRITEALAGGGKLDPDAMASIQADAVSLLGAKLRPHFLAAAAELAAYVAAPARDAASPLKPVVDAAPAPVRAFYAEARALVEGWSLNTPSGYEAGLDTAGIDDSRAALLVAAFSTRLARLTFADELAALGDEASGFRMPSRAAERALYRLLDAPGTLASGSTGEPGERGEILFDDLGTPDVVETRQVVLARAVSEAIAWAFAEPKLGADPRAWRWGAVHTAQPAFFVPLGLDQDAYPRHGGIGTVDVADHGYDDDNYSFRGGAAIRFVCELDPDKGPVARNVVPGGQIFDSASPHYKDQLELWSRNEAPALPFRLDEVVPSAEREQAKNGLGRLRFTPAP
ncbi:MAG TPA: penicillin acylase family protein [Polyangiaceae bacterium]|nr:penicillin acylase family protein [Polyangiaceae bacterium]